MTTLTAAEIAHQDVTPAATVHTSGDVLLSLNVTDEGEDFAIAAAFLSSSAARKLAATLIKSADAAEAMYAAQVKRAKLEEQVRKLQADVEAKLAALAAL